jgi:hypothetical protein
MPTRRGCCVLSLMGLAGGGAAGSDSSRGRAAEPPLREVNGGDAPIIPLPLLVILSHPRVILGYPLVILAPPLSS